MKINVSGDIEKVKTVAIVSINNGVAADIAELIPEGLVPMYNEKLRQAKMGNGQMVTDFAALNGITIGQASQSIKNSADAINTVLAEIEKWRQINIVAIGVATTRAEINTIVERDDR